MDKSAGVSGVIVSDLSEDKEFPTGIESKELADLEFAQEIKRLREKANLSQRSLGILIGVEQTIITRIEKANYGITLDLVMRFARAFHDDPHRLANIYWGTGSDQFINENKAMLDSIWDLIYPFYQPQIKSTSPIPPQRFKRNPETDAAIKEGVEEQKARTGKQKKAPQKQKAPEEKPDNG